MQGAYDGRRTMWQKGRGKGEKSNTQDRTEPEDT